MYICMHKSISLSHTHTHTHTHFYSPAGRICLMLQYSLSRHKLPEWKSLYPRLSAHLPKSHRFLGIRSQQSSPFYGSSYLGSFETMCLVLELLKNPKNRSRQGQREHALEKRSRRPIPSWEEVQGASAAGQVRGCRPPAPAPPSHVPLRTHFMP